MSSYHDGVDAAMRMHAMTDANQKLCRDIAEAEKRDIAEWGDECYRNGEWVSLDVYITDPAETVRMQEALVDGLSGFTTLTILRRAFVKGVPVPVATARAYLAMLQKEAQCEPTT